MLQKVVLVKNVQNMKEVVRRIQRIVVSPNVIRIIKLCLTPLVKNAHGLKLLLQMVNHARNPLVQKIRKLDMTGVAKNVRILNYKTQIMISIVNNQHVKIWK